MDWNDAIERAKKTRAPEVAVDVAGNPVGLVDGLISRLRGQDEADRKLLRRMMIFFGLGGVIYVLIFTLTWIAPPNTSPELARFVLALFSLIFISLGVMSAFKARDLAGIDYAKPVDLFLLEAARRYRFISTRDLLFIVPYYIIISVTSGLGWMNAFSRYFSWLDATTGIATFLAFWAGTSLFGLYMGRREWKKNRAPLLDEIRSMRAELSAVVEGSDL